MLDKIKRFTKTKMFHLCMVIVIIAVILFAVGIIALRYAVEGETNMPFELSKITVISSSEGKDKVVEASKWAFDINQNNDIYLYIEKNDNSNKQEIIKEIEINNINVEKNTEKGEIKIYKPTTAEEATIFSNKEENEIQSIIYTGDLQSDLKQQKVSNQGGIIAFRYGLNNVSEYLSQEEEINHSELLKKSNVTEEDLKAKLIFDIIIRLESGKEYKASISLDVPVEGIIEKGTTSIEKTDLSDVVFKRIKN